MGFTASTVPRPRSTSKSWQQPQLVWQLNMEAAAATGWPRQLAPTTITTPTLTTTLICQLSLRPPHTGPTG